jgi:nucleotide-binding universal stress UspA family protein
MNDNRKGESLMKIVVATDGSPASVAAVKFAAKLADSDANTELIILTVDSHLAPDSSSKAAHSPADAQRVLKGAARHVRENRARFQVVAARRADEVPEAISREADRLKADVIVVGSAGRESLEEWVVGGTALRLIYVARRPVTVVRAPRRRGVAQRRAAGA